MMRTCLLALTLLGACGPATSPPPAGPIDNQPPPAEPVTIPHQATLAQLRELIAAGALERVELPIVEQDTEYRDIDGKVESAPGVMMVTVCWNRAHALLEDADGRVHVVIGVNAELARGPAAGALLGIAVAPSCDVITYALEDGRRAGWHIEVLEDTGGDEGAR